MTRWGVMSVVVATGCALNGQRIADHAVDRTIHHVQTEDGAHITLQRYERPGAPAVVLCHGISSNHHFWDLDPEHSLAVHLWEAGFDVWNLDLRGHGFAVRNERGRRPRPAWTVDDYGNYDLPAAFHHVQTETHDQPLHYVGHSLGGMVLAVYLTNHGDAELTSATVVGSPLAMYQPEHLSALLVGLAPKTRFVRRWPTGWLSHGLVLAGPLAPNKIHRMLYNPNNLSPARRRAMLRTIVSPMVRGEVLQLAQLRDGTFRSADGSVSYAERLGDVTLPMLFIAGRADHIAPPDTVRAYYDAVGSEDRVWFVASRANGLTADYGHLDLGVGEAAPQDVYPVIEAFLQGHSEGR